jgi:hypothetical protein
MADEEEKKTVSPEKKAARRAVRVLAFSTWRKSWKAENPTGTKEERKLAWDAVRGDEVRKARQMVKTLERGGFKIVPVQP